MAKDKNGGLRWQEINRYKNGNWEFGHELLFNEEFCFIDIGRAYANTIAEELMAANIFFMVKVIGVGNPNVHTKIYVRPENINFLERWSMMQ